MDIRAAELTADHLGRIVKINPGDLTVIIGRAHERQALGSEGCSVRD